MAEEVAAAVAAGGGATENGTADDPNKKERKPREPEVPIEDLYDLSKPIPKVERPNRDAHDKELAAIQTRLDQIKAHRQAVQDKIDAAMTDPKAAGGLQEQRKTLADLKAKKGALIEEKKTMRSAMDQARSQTDKLIKDKKDVKSNIKFTTLAEIDKEITRLQRLQETTSMSLQAEKKLIKEMDALSASKKFIKELQAKDSAMDNIGLQRKSIKEQIAAKDKEIDAVSAQIDVIMVALKAQNEKDSTKRDAIQGLFAERDEFKKSYGAILKEKDAIRDEFRAKNNAWYNMQRAVRAQKKIQYAEEKKAREEEKAAYLAKLEEEEAKKIPYEEEQALCEQLAEYLERTYLKKGTTEMTAASKTDVVQIKDDPFAGMVAVGKKNDEEDDNYFGKGKGKKRRVRQAKKQDQSTAFTLSVDVFEQFGLLQLTPPVTAEQVEGSVEELRKKKEWYKEQPRGSVPTAADIRNGKKKAPSGTVNASKTKKTPTSFSLQQDDFAPLGAGSTATTAPNAMWGKGSAVAAAEQEDEES